jgi:hypothetical protein
VTDDAATDDPSTDEAARRRKRTDAYCSLWAVPTVSFSNSSSAPSGSPHDQVPVIVGADRRVQPAAAIRWRAMSLALVALKGQGLSQHEVFGIADGWDLWDHLTLEENDFILDPSPTAQEMVNAAWRFEGVQVLAWAAGLVRHLAFADTPVDTGAMTELVVVSIAGSGEPEALGASVADSWTLRPQGELLDGADIARRLAVVSQAALAAGVNPVVHPGIAHERDLAFGWLLPALD